MHVPYSMDDREPDLYGGMGGYSDDEYTQTKWEGNGYGSARDHEVDATPHSVFCYTQEDMTRVITSNLKITNEYRLEIEELLGLLSYIYNHSEKLPHGVSQKIREEITMQRIWEDS